MIRMFNKLQYFIKVARWCNKYSIGLAVNRPWVQFLLGAKLCNSLKQVFHNYLPVSPSSIAWYGPMGGDALRLGR